MNYNSSFKKTLLSCETKYNYFSINEFAKKQNKDISKLPYCLKILLENLIRFEDNNIITVADIESIIDSVSDSNKRIEIPYRPSRVLMQDFTGVPAVVDLAAMRDAVKTKNFDLDKINPKIPVDLVIDHSVQVDFAGNSQALKKNIDLEISRNLERYEFLKWGQKSFKNFRVVPPGVGICHQINLENLAKVVFTKESNGELFAYPDTVVGTDSHTTMINGLAVLGWGVGGIEAESAMLGQPISMLIPEVLGFRLTGKLQEGITATDLVLTITNILRSKGVVGKFVEFFGDGLINLSLADRATIANMAPEYGATCGIFPIDQETINYLKLTGRDKKTIQLVEDYAKEQGMFYSQEPEFSEILELDISQIEPVISGPKRPQDKILLSESKDLFTKLTDENKVDLHSNSISVANLNTSIKNGDLVIAAITSCTNTSNPDVLIAAGLLARNAFNAGLKVDNIVKTSFAPGSRVVGEYMENSGLQNYLDKIGFNIIGYGCTTCIGNSGPLDSEIEKVIKEHDLFVTSVLSGNRNFEGRVHSLTKANYLASPPLVIAYALAGTMNIDLTKDSIGIDTEGNNVYLKDIWPSNEEINKFVNSFVGQNIFTKRYADMFIGDQQWQNIKINKSDTYEWNPDSTYIRLPDFFEEKNNSISDIKNSSILALLGDSITTDHISPAGKIALNSPAAKYLKDNNIQESDFNSYGSRRGNHEVMVRGTFANIRIKNKMTPEVEGGYTKTHLNGEVISIYDAAIEYKKNNTPLVVIAGAEYGTGSSRDWAAKGTRLLGVKAVIACSFERIHRSNLIGMGVLPLCFKNSDNAESLNLTGFEKIDILGINNSISPQQDIKCIITTSDGNTKEITLLCRLDTSNEVEYYKNGGILQYAIQKLCD